MKRSTAIALGIGATLIATGAGIALASSNTESPKLPPSDPKQPPQDDNQSNNRINFINQALAGVSEQLPGVKESVEIMALWIEADPQGVAAVVSRFRDTSQRFASAASAAASAAASRLAQARGILSGLKVADDTVQAISKVPLVGQIVAGIYQVARPFVAAAAEAKAAGNDLFAANWKPGGKPVFTGWLGDGSGTAGSGDYFIQDVPILSFGSPIMVVPFLEYSPAYAQPMSAFLRLTVARPLGLDVVSVTIDNNGFYYAFNASGNNDISDEAVARKEVFALTVWNPIDINKTGPRGFDRNNPRAWVAAARAEALREGWIDPAQSPYGPFSPPSESPAVGL